MSREIKFRGKRVDNGNWVYGFYGWSLGKTYITKVQVASPSESNPGGDYFEENYEIIDGTLGQFTNRLSEDLRDIYEGDILKTANGKMWEVVFDSYSWKIKNDRIKDNGRNKFGGKESYTFQEYIEICKRAKSDIFIKFGNIHDNPELLQP